MRTVSVRLIDLSRAKINLGFVGENEHTRVVIDCKKAFDEYPEAIPSIAVKNANGDSYPAVTVRDGNFVRWDVLNSDLVYEGSGEIQLAFVVGDVVAKSYIGKTIVGRSIESTGDIPTPVENWIESANEVLGEIPVTIEASVNGALQEAKESGEFDGADGQPGEGVPTGGTAGQVLAKKTGTDYDTEWINQSGGGGAVESVNGKTGAVVLDAQDVGAYAKPNGGIPASDLAQAVQTSLGKADSAVQTETDPTVPAWAKAANKPSYSWSEIEGRPTIPVVPTNVSAFENDAGYLTAHQDLSGKVNEPATEGTSGQVLTTDGQGGRSWADIEKAPVTISGTTPTITALSGIQYVCGEVATLDITLPASGIVDVVFTSGSTPTVLTVTPPSGLTMKWANGFDPDNLEADTVYEINVLNGCLGVAGAWS